MGRGRDWKIHIMTVKEAKLYTLKDKLIRFKMQEENISQLFHNIDVIVNKLRNLGDKMSVEDYSHWFFRCLPLRFDTLVPIIIRSIFKDIIPI